MPRRPRIAPGGFSYHVVNRAAGRLTLFESASDFAAFERLLRDVLIETGMRILAYCLMRNHWHLLLWPIADGDLTTFMHRLTSTHARRWVLAHDAVGRGAVYQSRFKSIPVQTNHHLIAVWRYIERNPLRANLVRSAEDWDWSSLSVTRDRRRVPVLCGSPIDLPSSWADFVNAPQTNAELGAIRGAIASGEPFGDAAWSAGASEAIGWRPQGRPKRGRTPFSLVLPEKGVRPLFKRIGPLARPRRRSRA
jgi:putative transposase